MVQNPVRPRHAASLVLTRHIGGTLHVLMGRRPSRAVFAQAWVFPGGRLDKGDSRIAPSAPLNQSTLDDLCNRGGCTPAMAQGLATTAIRETYEETGLLLADSGNPGRNSGTWSDFARAGLAPAHDRLRFLGRAITPTSAPVRFHARFFHANGEDLAGSLRENGELLSLDWYSLATARDFEVIDVTRFVLAELAAADQGAQRPAPFFRYRRNKPVSPA
jgi:8-oxo-dGTP pyrophosphatase MutT (NUDIX family)